MVKVHVNQHVIRANKKNNETNPPLTIIRGSRKRTRHMEVKIIGQAKIVYSPNKPLSCGARVWIECEDAVGADSTIATAVDESSSIS